MRALEQLVLVVELALEVEDRSPAEQRALIAVARKLDSERNLVSVSNPLFAEWNARRYGTRSTGDGPLEPVPLDALPLCTFRDPERPDLHRADRAAGRAACKCEGNLRGPCPDSGQWSRLEATAIDTYRKAE